MWNTSRNNVSSFLPREPPTPQSDWSVTHMIRSTWSDRLSITAHSDLLKWEHNPSFLLETGPKMHRFRHIWTQMLTSESQMFLTGTDWTPEGENHSDKFRVHHVAWIGLVLMIIHVFLLTNTIFYIHPCLLLNLTADYTSSLVKFSTVNLPTIYWWPQSET